MLQELKLNDVVVAEDLRIYYYKDNRSNALPLFSTSKDAYESLFYDPQNYFKHLVSNDHSGAQFITDNFELVLRHGSALHKPFVYAKFHHYAKDISTEIAIQNRVNVAVCNNEKVLFIKNLISEQCRELHDKTIKIHKVLQC